MDYRDFYIWLDGFMTNRSWTIIRELDIETIQTKMKEVRDINRNNQPTEIVRPAFNPFEPINIPAPKNPFDITCKTNLDD